MNEDSKILSKNLRKLMDYYGDTQAILERRSGVSQKTISNMLNPGDERSPNLNNVALIAAAYKMKTWHLLIPDAPLDVLSSKSVETLINHYMYIDKEGKKSVLLVSKNLAKNNIKRLKSDPNASNNTMH